jgi:ABC-2 type transport system ATP-binding protein
MTDLAIEIRGLRKVYRSGFFRREYVGLHGLDLDVHRGEVLGYIGPNGAGKTTTIKMLMGLNLPTAGEVKLLGQPLSDRSVRRRIGFLPERPYFYDYLTASEFLHFYGSLHGMDKGARQRRIDELLPLVHMERARHVQLRKFSKGMLQRVGVAQALINDPELVVLDEPSSGLDPMGRMLIRDIILGLKEQGKTVLLASHILSDVEEICDRVAIVARGQLRQVATIGELVGHEVASVEVRFVGIADEQLAAVAPQGHRKTPHGHTVVEADSVDAGNALARAVLDHGGSIVSLIPRRESLEQLFVDEMTAIERVDREKP